MRWRGRLARPYPVLAHTICSTSSLTASQARPLGPRAWFSSGTRDRAERPAPSAPRVARALCQSPHPHGRGYTPSRSALRRLVPCLISIVAVVRESGGGVPPPERPEAAPTLMQRPRLSLSLSVTAKELTRHGTREVASLNVTSPTGSCIGCCRCRLTPGMPTRARIGWCSYREVW